MKEKKLKKLVRGKRMTYINGKPKPIYFSAINDKELQKKMLLWEMEQNKPQPVPFNKYAEEWYWSVESTISERTAQEYKTVMNKLIEKFGDMNLETMDTIDAQNYFNEMNKQKSAKSTIKHRRNILRNVFDYCISKRLLKYNPILYTTIPKTAVTKKIKPATVDHIKVICESLNHPFGLYPFLLCYTGLRKSEALALTWDDIDFKNSTMLINKKLTYQSQKPKLESILKNGEDERTQIILDDLLKVLKTFKEKSKSKLLFPSELNNKEYMLKSHAETAWKKYCDAAGIKINMHQLRHSFATILHKAGVDVKTAQVLMGHKDIKVTLQIYTEIENEQFEKAKTQLNEYVSKNSATFVQLSSNV